MPDSPTPAPVLDTGRARLRAPALADFDSLVALWADPAVTRFIGTGQPLGREEVWSRLVRQVGHWHVFGYGYWVIADPAHDGVLGEMGFAANRREIDPPVENSPEIGWVLAPHAQGRGLAGETVAAALAWADSRFARTSCLIHPDHAASIRIATTNGYRETGRATYRARPTVVFTRG